jgi:hypothetical protein
VTRRVNFSDWQRMREAMRATQTGILARQERPADGAPDHVSTGALGPAQPRVKRNSRRPAEWPAGCRPLHSHKPRSDEEWAAIEDGVRALLAERKRSGRWRWVGSRRVIVE